MKVIYRPIWYADIADGVNYLAEQASPAIALRWDAAVSKTVGMIVSAPGIGRRRPALSLDHVRSLSVDRPFSRWLIFYQDLPEAVVFLRIKHGAMNLPALFER